MTSGKLKKRMKRADYTTAGKPKQDGEVYQSFIARENVQRKTAEERVATSNVDTGRIEEKISCSSVFIDMSVVAISGG